MIVLPRSVMHSTGSTPMTTKWGLDAQNRL